MIGKYEFLHLPLFPASFHTITFLPNRTGLAISDSALVHFAYNYLERPNVPAELLKSYKFQDAVKTYFSVPSANITMVLAGNCVYMVDMFTHVKTLVFENVSSLCPHHSGMEATIIPILQA